jgi:hypothetical protein
MKVWILEDVSEYEGNTFCGVFSTEEKAEEDRDKILSLAGYSGPGLERRKRHFDIWECQVDG